MQNIQVDETRRRTATVTDRARRALDEAARRGLPPEPRVFELFFAYLGGEDAALVAAVDAELSEEKTPNLDAVDRIYEAHLALGDRAARFAELGAQAERGLTELGDLVARKGEVDGDFRKALTRTRDEMSILMRPAKVKRTIFDLMEATGRHARQSEAFEADLRAAQARIQELTAEVRELRESAYLDHLTGLANRRRYDVAMDLEIAARPQKGGFSLVLADLDHFKKLNDGFGHAVGDSVLKQFARLIRQNVKGTDTAARYGGEEFAMILPSTELLGARHVAERIRQSLAARSFVISGTRERLGVVTASFGVAEHREGETAQQLFHRTDEALYQAKSLGRNRVVCAA